MQQLEEQVAALAARQVAQDGRLAYIEITVASTTSAVQEVAARLTSTEVTVRNSMDAFSQQLAIFMANLQPPRNATAPGGCEPLDSHSGRCRDHAAEVCEIEEDVDV